MPDAGPNLDRLNLREYAGVRQMNASRCQAIIDADAFHGLADGVTHWDVLRRIDRAAVPMGYSRALMDTLRLLYSFSRPQDWRKGSRPIVWPSNERLMCILGLSRSGLKLRLRSLADNRLLAFRDSPTGKRYGVRDDRQELVLSESYGIDLSPVVALLEICDKEYRRDEMEREMSRRLRRRRTVAVRRVREAINTLISKDLYVDIAKLQAELCSLPVATDPRLPFDRLEAVVREAEALRDRAMSVVGLALGVKNSVEPAGGTVDVAVESNSDPVGLPQRPLIQETTDNIIDSSIYSNGRAKRWRYPTHSMNSACQEQKHHEFASVKPSRAAVLTNRKDAVRHFRPSTIAKILPTEMREFLEATVCNRPPTWADLVQLVQWQLPVIGVSEDAWRHACHVLGRPEAALAVVLMCAKRSAIRHMDAYLGGMAGRALAGTLRLERSLVGALRRSEVC